MALLLSPTVSFLASSSASPPRARALSTAASANNVVPSSALRLQCKNTASFSHVSPSKKTPVIVHASADAGAADAAEQPEKQKPAASIEEMPLESKQKMILEQRARMKAAKKLRQRRRRLVQKRRLRKKGSWPPSKMKKLKNI
ncbi:50S ribosomal protein 5, chloroplastic-like [Lolium rigidum]|uniref:50S ribosomal protein 5, chloroplastic-like n=1 Tax=Lolium rigidum TaxID=89674 RepID=UPI001F5C746C|nr:50S ribosomal protein 5, chloroplastic-like [Lolium rigidum]